MFRQLGAAHSMQSAPQLLLITNNIINVKTIAHIMMPLPSL